MDIFNQIKHFSPQQKEGYVEVSLPIAFYASHGSLLTFSIAPKEGGFVIACLEDLFYESNDTQARYFNIFMKHDKHYHYDMQILNDVIYKEYPENHSVTMALNDFIRFFIMFDDFIMDNDVICHEEDFE